MSDEEAKTLKQVVTNMDDYSNEIMQSVSRVLRDVEKLQSEGIKRICIISKMDNGEITLNYSDSSEPENIAIILDALDIIRGVKWANK